MGDDYYSRTATEFLGGYPMFQTAEDRKAEDEVAAIIEEQWRCKLNRFGLLCPVDWYALRLERMAGLIELKSRSHASTTYKTVYLNVRKWIALNESSRGLGVPAIFVVRFTDGIRWCSLYNVDATKHKMGGCSKKVKSHTDREPVIEVPIEQLKSLKGFPQKGQ